MWINAENIINKFGLYVGFTTRPDMLRAIQIIKDEPSIDIVRCGECKKRKKNKFCLEHMRYEKDDNSFCSYGERRK